MRITKWVDMGQEVEIEIGVDDVRAALVECFGEIGPSKGEILMALNNIGTFVRAITDAQIAQFNEHQRKAVADFLAEQAKRFAGGAVEERRG